MSLPGRRDGIVQENHYYPFGMLRRSRNPAKAGEGSWEHVVSEPGNDYLYNGKEMQGDLGLDWLDYGVRFYDAAIGRWNGVDPLSEKYYSWSGYNYVLGNPIRFIDPDGRSVDGDIYSLNGTHLGTDGVDDNRVYVTNSTEHLTENEASALVAGHDFVRTWSGSEGGGGLTELSIGHDAFQQLAATVYGEASTANNTQEMFGIASATVNNNTARGAEADLIATILEIAFAASDGNERFGAFTNAGLGARNNSAAMTDANAAAINALTGGHDYSNGATGWDGSDLPNNSHRFGLNISNSSHDIYNVGDRPLTNPENGSLYRRQTTAAQGGTVFMRIHPDYVNGGGRAY